MILTQEMALCWATIQANGGIYCCALLCFGKAQICHTVAAGLFSEAINTQTLGLYSLERCILQLKDLHYKPKKVWQLSQIYNGNPCTNKTVSCLWTEAQDILLS